MISSGAENAATKPSRAWYWVGALILAGGAVATATVALSAAAASSRTYDRYARLAIPEDARCRLTFSKPGTYQVFYEHSSVAPARDAECNASAGRRIVGPSTAPAGLQLALIGPDGRRIEAKVTGSSESISTSDHDGELYREVSVPASGDYTVDVTGGGDKAFVISVGRGAGSVLRRGLITALVLGVSTLALGLASLFGTAGRRRRSRRALSTQVAALPPPTAASLISGSWPIVQQPAASPVPTPTSSWAPAAPTPQPAQPQGTDQLPPPPPGWT